MARGSIERRQRRCLLIPGGFADHLVALALRRREHGIVNVCSRQPVSVRSLVERWLAANAWTVGLDLGRHPYPAREPMAFWGDATKLRHRLRAP